MSKQRIQLSDHFTYPRLLRFVLPCIGTMLFTSIYGIVDGLCVSNFVGKTAFAAVNLIMPLPMLLGTIGFMLGTGGSAIVGITLGEGDQKKADRYFTLFLLAALVSVSVLAVLGIVFLRPIAVLLGAKGELLDYAVRYGRILMVSLPTFALQNMFQSFFVTAEKPHLGFWFTVGAGCTNMVLDVLMVGVWGWGVEGAAIATFISQLVGGVLPVFYFIDRSNTSRLHLCQTKVYGGVLRDACINGSSELMTNLSMSLVNILYNFQLLRLAGENGVAAYGVIMYAAFLFVAVFVGYAVGSAPIVSFHYGARNHAEVHNLYRKSLRLIAVVAVTLTLASMFIIPCVARVFVGYDAELLALTSRAFRLYALSFLIMGFNVYASSFFTALGDGVTSALISFLRTLAFQVIAILLLPMLLGIDGIWLAVTAAELAALAVSAAMLLTKDKVFAVCHDGSIERTSNGTGSIHEMTMAQLKQYDFGVKFSEKFAGTRISSLDEMLEVTHGMDILNIELKGPLPAGQDLDEALSILYASLEKYHCVERTIISTFEHAWGRRIKELYPQLKMGLLYGDHLTPEQTLELVTAYKADAIHPELGGLTPDIVAACRANHILINAWTVDTPEAIRRAIDLQVDGIITNVPDKVLAALGR